MNFFSNIFSKKSNSISLQNRLMESLFQYTNKGAVYNYSGNLKDNVNHYQENDALYSIINLIIRNIQSVEWKLYEIKNKKAFDGFKATQNQPISIKSTLYQKNAFNEIESHPIISNFFETPNKRQGFSEFIEEFFGFKLLTGNGYINGIRQPFGENKDLFQEFFVMPSHLVEIITGGWQEPVKSYRLEFLWNERFEIPANDVLHSRNWNPNYVNGEWLYGLAPSKAVNKPLNAIDEGNNANVKSFQNMGAVGILSTDNFKTDELFGETLVKKYYEKFGGTDNAGKVMFSPIPLKYLDMAKSAVDMDILASNKDALRSVCNAWGLQSQLLNDPDNKTYNNQKDARKALFTDVVMPLLNNFSKEVNRWLIQNYNDKGKTKLYAAPNWREHPVLQDEFESLTTSLKDAWWLTPNEKRIMQGLGELDLPNMNNILIPNNLAKIEAINNTNTFNHV